MPAQHANRHRERARACHAVIVRVRCAQRTVLSAGSQIRYRITVILDERWEDFFQSRQGWIRPVVLETVRRLLMCRTPALGCHVYHCPSCGRLEVVPHSCKSRFCPTCGKHATDRWADAALNDLLDVPYHHLVLAAPWQLRPLIAFQP